MKIPEDAGLLELRPGGVYKCLYSDSEGLRWRLVLSREKLDDAIDGTAEYLVRELARALQDVADKTNCICKFLPMIGEPVPCERCRQEQLLSGVPKELRDAR